MNWPVYSLGLLIEADGGVLQTGPFGSQLKQAEYTDYGIPVIMPKDIENGQVNTKTVARVPEGTADRLSRHKMRAYGIILPRRGAITKRAFMHPDQAGWLCGTGCIKVEATGRRIWPKYLYYYMGTVESVDWLEKNAVGSTMLNLSTEIVSRLPLACPDIETQKQIAYILSAYDDLIENNRSRIVLLEEAARLLYREWFVHFRFPGHEHCRIIDGIPEGWERRVFEDVCKAVGGGTPRTSNPGYWNDGNIPWYTPTDITRNSCLALLDSTTKITEAGLRGSSAKMLPLGTVLMTSRASVGFFGITDAPSCTNQGFINILPHDSWARMYLLHNLMHRVEEIRSHAGGATYREISKGKFRVLPVVFPGESLLRDFEDQASLLHAQVWRLHTMNHRLIRARDLLLPRLMNGEIAV